MQELKPYIRITVTTVAIIFIVLAVSEIGGRVYIWLAYGVPGKSYGIHHHDPVLKGRFRANSYNLLKEFNNLAFQSTEDTQVPKPDGVFRIITYGGSTTICFNLPTGQCWPKRLQDDLRSRGFTTVEVLNAGDAEWSLAHAYARAGTELEQLEPDLVILYSGFNEERNAFALKREGLDLAVESAKGRIGVFTRLTLQADTLYRNSIVYKAWFGWLYKPHIRPVINRVRKLFRDRRKPANDPQMPRPDVLAHYFSTLKAFLALIRASGAQPVFIIQAANPTHASAMHRSKYSRAGAKIARADGASVYDAQKIVSRRDGNAEGLFIETGYHLTSTGAAELARFLADTVNWADLGATRQ